MKTKRYKKYISILGIIIATSYFSCQVSAHTDIDSDSSDIITDTISDSFNTKDDTLIVKPSIFVNVQVVGTYCDNGAGFGKVSFRSEPHNGAAFQILGEYASGGSAVYTFHIGEHSLPSGVYTWSALPILSIKDNIEPSSGKFNIDIKCNTASDTKHNLADTIYTDGNEDGSTNSSTVIPTVSEPSTVLDTHDNNEQWVVDPNSNDFVADDTSIIRSVLSGTHILSLETQHADIIEWYVKREPGDIFKYLGTATFNKEKNIWGYAWDTTQVPNGDYVLVPEIKSSLGKIYKHTPSYITVKNKEIGSIGISDASLIDQVKEVSPQIVLMNDANKDDEIRAKENIVGVTVPYYDKVQEYIENNPKDTLQKEEFIKIKESSERYLKRMLDVESNKLLDGALRDDEEKKKHIREKIITASNNSLGQIDEVARGFGIELSDKEFELMREKIRIRMAEFERVAKEREKGE